MTTARDAEPAHDDLVESGPDAEENDQVSRRVMMRTAAVAGTVVAATAGLAACGSGGSSGGSGGSSGGSGSGGGAGAGTVLLGSTSDIPVGGGKIFTDHKVVVTQPTNGSFQAFSTTCTHLGCTVNKVANGLIQCPCHGSKYSIVDGTVRSGPAPKPLPPEHITVSGNEITLS